MSKADQIVSLLTEIRDLLQTPMPQEEAGECPHPEEARINLRAMGDPGEHFKCRTCQRVIRTHVVTTDQNS